MISLYFLANWLPTLAKESGLSLNQALLIGSTLQLGGTIGSVVMGLKIDKTGFYKVLIPVFLVAVISVALIGYSVSHIVLLFIIILLLALPLLVGNLPLMLCRPVITQFHFVLQGWAGVLELLVWVLSLGRYLAVISLNFWSLPIYL
ncbi:4-hydroxybenzoate transporter PcaK [Acinetobacter baumannii]|nr:4-hydroxybenzoate transporter PcaK [Acinetobacter baumannii]